MNVIPFPQTSLLRRKERELLTRIAAIDDQDDEENEKTTLMCELLEVQLQIKRLSRVAA